MPIDGIVERREALAVTIVKYKLVSAEIKINPAAAFPPKCATKNIEIKPSSGG